MRALLALLLLLWSSASLAADLSRLELGEIRAQLARGTLLYVAPVSGGVAVVDVSDPAAPKIVGRFAPGRLVSRILLSGDSLVLLESHEEATLWSLADPRAPAISVAAAPQVAATPAAAVAGPSSSPRASATRRSSTGPRTRASAARRSRSARSGGSEHQGQPCLGQAQSTANAGTSSCRRMPR